MNEGAAKSKKSFGDMVVGYFKDFSVLKETRSEYWGIQVINFLDCTIYFAMIAIASVFLSDDLGLNDANAGYVIALFTTATTIFLFISGMVTDWLGIKKAIYIAMGSMLVLRLGMAVVGLVDTIPHRGWIAAGLFLLMAPFMAMLQTVFQAANKRFTTTRSRSAGFSLWYLFMNLGAMCGGLLIDLVRRVMGVPNAHIFSFGAIAALLCTITVLLMIRREDQLATDDIKKNTKENEDGPGDGKEISAEPIAPEKKKNPFQIAREVLRESTFWKLAVLIALILGVRAVFTYMYLLMPKYWLRTIGPDVAMGTLQAVNPFLIVVGIILLIPLVNKFNIFKALIYGSMISAVSLFALVLPWQWLSPDIGYAHYYMALIFMVLLTIGEIIWSPKLNEYTAAIAPQGQEGTYLGLTMVPWFLAKTGVSLLSGHMLIKWCPEVFKIKSEKLMAYFQQSGFGAAKLAENTPNRESADVAEKLGIDVMDTVSNINSEALMAKAGTLGINVQEFLAKVDQKTIVETTKAFGVEMSKLNSNIEPAHVVLQLKIISIEVSQALLSGAQGVDFDTIGVSLRFAMTVGWVAFWESPAAMWLVLGGYAFGGCLIALAIKGWLTKGAKWKIEHSDSDENSE